MEKHTAKGENVLLSWQHSALSEVARELGVKGLSECFLGSFTATSTMTDT